MADALTTISHLINSPPGQLAAGGVLAGVVWKFFERVESVLNEDTKLEIALWLLEVKVGEKVEPWPDTFAKVFDRVFGTKHFSLRCFWRSCVASYSVAAIAALVGAVRINAPIPGYWTLTDSLALLGHGIVMLLIGSVIGNVLPDYISLLETRIALRILCRRDRTATYVGVLAFDLLFTIGVAIVAAMIAGWVIVDVLVLHGAKTITEPYPFSTGLSAALFINQNLVLLWILPAFFTSIWLWLYAGSGFLLKAARRFDIGFDWFNRKFDIEKKPLQSIGLVAGALVAVVYWTAVIVSKMIG